MFLFKEFLQSYRKFFIFEKRDRFLKCNFYSWEDQLYSSFMKEFLTELEPRCIENNTTLYDELEEITEIYFFPKGQVIIGFGINRKKQFVLRHKNDVIVADHGCTFNIKSQFIYKTQSQCTGFAIRKQSWQKLLSKYPEIAFQIKQMIITKYFLNIQLKVLTKKNQKLRQLIQRADIHQLLTLIDIDKALYKKILESELNRDNYQAHLLDQDSDMNLNFSLNSQSLDLKDKENSSTERRRRNHLNQDSMEQSLI